MQTRYFAAVDLGATSGRVILASVSATDIRMEEVHRFPDPILEVGGHFYWNLPSIYQSILDGLRKIAARNIPIASIGIDTWGVDFVLFGRDGGMLRLPYCYRDPHTADAPEHLFERLPREELYARTGIQIMHFNTVFQLDTLRRNRCSALEAADKILFIPDALSYLLTGRAVTEYTIASTSQLLDARTRQWDAAILAQLGLTPAAFGRMVEPGDVIGTLTEEVQRQTGLGPVPVVAVAGHDTASAVAAVPAAEGERFAYLSSGTWSLMGIEAPAPVITDESYRMNFTNEGGIGGTVRVLKNICGMWLLERCRTEWPGTDYEELIAAAEKAAPLRSLINPDAPCFANPTSMTRAIADYCRATQQPVPENIGAYVRCIFESLALRYRQVLEMLRTLSPGGIDKLYVIGGGSRNDLLNRMTADATGIPVETGSAESTALGNVMVQAQRAGAVASTADMRRMIRRSLTDTRRYEPGEQPRWQQAYGQYMGIYREL